MVGVEVDREVLDADPDVVELDDAAEPDLAVAACRGQLVAACRGADAAVLELCVAEGEPVLADDEARDDVGAAARGVDVVTRVRVVRADRASHVELRERDARRVDPYELLVAPAGRVVLHEDPGGADVDDVRHVAFERRDSQRELAREAGAEVATEDAERVDRQVEGADDAGQVEADPAGALRGRLAGGRRARATAEVEAGAIEADRDRQHQHALVEADVGDPDARALQRERPEADRAVTGRGTGGVRVERERRLACNVCRSGQEFSGTERDRDCAGLEDVDRVRGVLVLQEEAIRDGLRGGFSAAQQERRAEDHGDTRRVHGQVGDAGAAQLERRRAVLDRRLDDRAAVVALEGDVEIPLGVQRLRRQRVTTARRGERRARARLRTLRRHEEGLLRRVDAVDAGAARAAVVGERAGQEVRREHPGRREAAGEGVAVGVRLAGHLRGRAVDRDARRCDAVDEELELGRRVKERAVLHA